MRDEMKPLAIVLKAMDSLPPVLKEFLRPARHPMGQCSGQAPWGPRFLSPVSKTRAKLGRVD